MAKSRHQKRQEAAERQAAYEARTPAEQIAQLDERGVYHGDNLKHPLRCGRVQADGERARLAFLARQAHEQRVADAKLRSLKYWQIPKPNGNGKGDA